MRRWLARTIFAGTAAGLLGVVLPQDAAAKKATEWTCADFLTISDESKPHVIYWMEGFNVAGKPELAEVKAEDFDRPIAMVVSECEKEPTANLWAKIKEFFSNF